MEKRSIIFRGKTIDNKWVEGDLIQIGNGTLIYHGSKQTVDVIPEGDSICAVGFYENEISPVHSATVGQYTGLRDKNGVRVFEGDKISFTRWIGNWQSCDGTHKEITTIHDVVWDNGVARFGLTSPSSDTMKFREHPKYIYEVIGNIYDK